MIFSAVSGWVVIRYAKKVPVDAGATTTAPPRITHTTLISHLSYPITNSVSGTLYLPYRGEGSTL